MKQNHRLLSLPWAVALIACLCCALWGSAAPGIKTSYRILQIPAEDVYTQILFAGLRFTMAGLLTVAGTSVLERRPARPQKGSWKMIILLSIFQTVLQYLFYYIGLAHTSGVKASIITGSQVFWTILLACFLFRQERITAKKLLGCVLGFGGVILINWNQGGLTDGMKWNGEGFILLSALSYSVSSILVKDFSARENPLILSGYQFLLGGLVMILCGAALGGRLQHFSPEGAAILIYLSLVSTVAYALWAILLKYNPVSRVSVYGFMNPIFGVLLSAVILGERSSDLGIRAVIALILVSLGIFTVNRQGSTRALEKT